MIYNLIFRSIGIFIMKVGLENWEFSNIYSHERHDRQNRKFKCRDAQLKSCTTSWHCFPRQVDVLYV